jgi:tetratricopeptide (TPR) repeat protein
MLSRGLWVVLRDMRQELARPLGDPRVSVFLHVRGHRVGSATASPFSSVVHRGHQWSHAVNVVDRLRIREIDKEIQQAVLLKRSGKVTEAEQQLAKCLERHRAASPGLLAPVHKSLAKLYYIQARYLDAEHSYREAVSGYRALGSEVDAQECLVHLATCHQSFISSPLLPLYVSGLRGWDTWAEVATPDLVLELLAMGQAMMEGQPPDDSAIAPLFLEDDGPDEDTPWEEESDDAIMAEEWAASAADAVREGDYEGAHHYLQMAFEADPGCVSAYVNLNILYGLLGRHELALRACLRGLQYNPGSPALLSCIGTTLLEMKDYQGAIPYYARAIEQGGQALTTIFNLAMCYDMLGQIDDALAWYEHAASLYPDDADARYNIAEIRCRKNQLSEAKGVCQHALQLFDEEYDEALYSYDLLSGESRSKDELLTYIKKRQSLADTLMAQIYFRLGELELALESIRKSTRAYPHSAGAFALMSQIHGRLGNEAEARSAWMKAQKLDPKIGQRKPA